MTDFPTYYDLLRRIHQYLRPRTYLEIGVHEGHSLALVEPGTRTVGVDPEPKATSPPPDTTIIASTSDGFFERPDIGDLLDGGVDLAFVDGLHLFEQTLRDIANVERHASTDGVILVHDCLPIDAVTSARERSTMVWSGDVWKSIVALRHHRPDLTIHTVDVAPTGLAVITGLDPKNTTLSGRFDRIVADVCALTFADLETHGRDDMLAVVPNSWEAISPLLPNPPVG